MFQLPDVTRIVAEALAEDLGIAANALLDGGVDGPEALLSRDVTTFATIGLDAWFSGTVVAREECVVAGLPVVAAVYERLSLAAGLFDPVEVFPLVSEGASVRPGTPVVEIEGLAAAVLTGERTALDFLMILSGIATETSRWVAAADGRLDVCDTRKTVPGLRDLSKYAVRVGGGVNHRTGLYDMVLVKDNHIARAGGITAAVGRARLNHPELLVEVEADTAAQAMEAVRAGADIVLLDNMDNATLTDIVDQGRRLAAESGRTVAFEASGGISIDRMPGLRLTGVERVSTSRLTLAQPVDFGLDETGPLV